jgi:subtilisin family serine protease
MFNKFLILIITFGIIVPSTIFAGKLDKIRESTIVYKLKETATAAQLKKFNALVKKENIISKKEIKAIRVNVVILKNIKGFERAFSDELMNTGAVKFAEPDVSILHTAIPNDEYYSSQWHHDVINSLIAWDNVVGPYDLSTVKVCVLDTGVDKDHPDLAGNLLLPGYNSWLDQDGNVEAVMGHGTGTAGVVGAIGNNNIGVVGMAWDIDIIPVKINFDDETSSAYYSDMMDGIVWCADQGVKVANLSYGGAQYQGIADAAQYLRDKGGLLFMSAGNDGTYNSIDAYPDQTSFIAVGATDQSDILTYFSEYGPFVDITAPGVSIRTTYLDGSYIYYSGTSFSSPMAAGLGALIYSVNPNFTPAEVEDLIFSTAVDLGDAGDDDLYGHGRIDAGAAVLAAIDYAMTPNELPVANATATPLSGIVPFDVAFDGSASTDDGTITTYVWNFGDGNTDSGATTTHTYVNEGTFVATLTVTDNRAAQTTSAPITIQVDPDPYNLNAPTNLTATVDGNSVLLNWLDNSSNETGFTIERAKKIRGKYNFTLLTTSGEDSTSYPDQVTEVGDYKYRLKAINNIAESDYSNELSVKVETVPVDPEPDPGTLSTPVLSTSVSGSTVTLSWSDVCPSTEVCTYYIDRGDAKVRGQIDFKSFVSGTGTAYTLQEAKGTYYYRVYVSTENSGQSDYSNVVSARVK